jgi:hypothetical protein
MLWLLFLELEYAWLHKMLENSLWGCRGEILRSPQLLHTSWALDLGEARQIRLPRDCQTEEVHTGYKERDGCLLDVPSRDQRHYAVDYVPCCRSRASWGSHNTVLSTFLAYKIVMYEKANSGLGCGSSGRAFAQSMCSLQFKLQCCQGKKGNSCFKLFQELASNSWSFLPQLPEC